MSWSTFLITSFVIGATVTSLILLLIAPHRMPVDAWLQQTWFGSPLHMFVATFVLGGCLGYMQPIHPLASRDYVYAGGFDWAYATKLFCTWKIVEILLWDILVVRVAGVDASISRWMQNTAYDAPLACGGAGFLCGHFFLYKNRFV